MATHSFLVVITPSVEGGFIASCPDLPGCFTQGDTLSQVRERIKEAILLNLDDLRVEGQPGPGGVMLTEYIAAAMRHAQYKILEDGSYYGEIWPDFPGVYANQQTLEATRDQLQEVLEDWLLLGLRLQHPLPVIDGLNLNEAKDFWQRFSNRPASLGMIGSNFEPPEPPYLGIDRGLRYKGLSHR